MVVLAPLLFLLLVGYVTQVRAARSLSPTLADFLRSPIVRATVFFGLVITVPLVFVERSALGGWLYSPRFLFLACVALSFLISFTWYRYLTWIDSFERERLRWEVLVFLLACTTTLAVPEGYRWLEVRGFSLTGEAWNDWWYCVFAIGGLEELAKLLPWLFIRAATRQVNEPFDLLLYASISALGFAFLENIQYLRMSELQAVMGRALMSSVAHMLFASVVAYGVAIGLYRGRRWMGLRTIGYLLIACVAHGFYDFWLLDPARPRLLTVLFFLASLQIWVVMKNNLVNISPHFNHSTRPASTMFRYRIINGLLFVLATAYVGAFLYQGRATAHALLTANANLMAALLMITAINFGSLAPIPGYIEPLRVPFNFFRWFVPRVEWEIDLTGVRVELRPHSRLPLGKRWSGLMAELPVQGTVIRRTVVDEDTDWYLLRPDRPIGVGDVVHELLLLQVHEDHDTLYKDRYVLVHVAAPPQGAGTARGQWSRGELAFLGHPLARLLPSLPSPPPGPTIMEAPAA